MFSGKGRWGMAKKPYTGDIKHCMQIGKHCDIKEQLWIGGIGCNYNALPLAFDDESFYKINKKYTIVLKKFIRNWNVRCLQLCVDKKIETKLFT